MRPLVLAMGVLGALLAATLAVEVAAPGSGDEDLAAATGIRPAPRLPRLDAARATAQVVDHTDAWVATILARPLFSRDRRPADAKVAEGSAGGEGLPRLTGIAISPIERSAIFAGLSGGKPIVVGEGGSVAGFTVKVIEPGAVQVVGPGGPRTLAPAFDPTPRTAASDNQPPVLRPRFPGLPLQPGIPLGAPGQPFTPGQFAPGRPRFGDGASNSPTRFDRVISDAAASQ